MNILQNTNCKASFLLWISTASEIEKPRIGPLRLILLSTVVANIKRDADAKHRQLFAEGPVYLSFLRHQIQSSANTHM